MEFFWCRVRLEFSTYWLCVENLPGDTLSAGCIQSALVLKVQNRLLPRCQLSVLDGLYIKGQFSSKLFVKHKPIWKIFLINCSNDGKKMGYTILFPPSANQTKCKIIKFGNLVLLGLKYSQSFAPER